MRRQAEAQGLRPDFKIVIGHPAEQIIYAAEREGTDHIVTGHRGKSFFKRWRLGIVIDLALTTCIHLRLGTPASYAEAFRFLADHGKLDGALAEHLVRAAGFRNLVAHAYERLDMQRVHHAAKSGPADLRAFLAALASRL